MAKGVNGYKFQPQESSSERGNGRRSLSFVSSGAWCGSLGGHSGAAPASSTGKMETARLLYGWPTEREQTVTPAPVWACRPWSTERECFHRSDEGNACKEPALEPKRLPRGAMGPRQGKSPQNEWLQNRGLKKKVLPEENAPFHPGKCS